MVGKSGSRARPDAGLTLVEMMVTLVVAGLVAGSTFVFFAGQQRIYETQTKLVNVQQNVTAAMELMVRFVRAAGSGMFGCVRRDSDAIGVGDPGPAAPTGPALPLTGAPAIGLRAFLSGVGEVRIPPIWITDGAAGAPDIITVAFGDGSFGNWADASLNVDLAAGTPLGNLDYPSVPTATALDFVFRTNDFIIVLDITQAPLRAAPFYNDRGCSVFQVSSVDMANNRLNRASGFWKWNPSSNAAAPNLVPFTYGGGATPTAGIRHFGTLNWVRFSIRAGTSTLPPALMMQQLHNEPGSVAQVLAEGIEDMQIAYACDTNPNDGDLPYGPTDTDEWVLNRAGPETIAQNCGAPEAIRLTLIARSLAPDTLLSQVSTNAKPAVENGAAGAVDQFRHRVLTTTVFPRNN